MATEREQLLHARELILAHRYDEARTVLLQFRDNETARTWLAKLDQIAPQGSPSAPATGSAPIPGISARQSSAMPSFSSVPASAGTQVNVAGIVASLRYAIAGVAAMMALLMIVGFFLFPWMDLREVEIMFGMTLGDFMDEMGGQVESEFDEGELKYTAMEIWMGNNNGENLSLDFDDLDSNALLDASSSSVTGGGFTDVRFLDRFLILIPVGAIVLMWLAWMYSTGALPAVSTALGMTVLALLLLLFPIIWGELSEQDWKNSFEDSMSDEGIESDLGFFGSISSFATNWLVDAISTDEQTWLGGIAFAVCLLGLVAEFAALKTAAPPGSF